MIMNDVVDAQAAFGGDGGTQKEYKYDADAWRNHSPLSLQGRVISESVSAFNKGTSDPDYLAKTVKHLINARNYLDLLQLHADHFDTEDPIKPLDWDTSPIPDDLYFKGPNGTRITSKDFADMIDDALEVMENCVEGIQQTRPEVIEAFYAGLETQPDLTWRRELAA